MSDQLFAILPSQISRLILPDATRKLGDLLVQLERSNLVNIAVLDFQTRHKDPLWTADADGGPQLLAYCNCRAREILVQYSGDFAA